MNAIRTLLPCPRGCSGLALVLAAALAAAPAPVRADDAKASAAPPPASPAETPTNALAEAWPDRPEWLDMYTDILQGSQLGPNDGWFRRARAQTRFGWDATRERYDRDGDGTIARGEFPGD